MSSFVVRLDHNDELRSWFAGLSLTQLYLCGRWRRWSVGFRSERSSDVNAAVLEISQQDAKMAETREFICRIVQYEKGHPGWVVQHKPIEVLHKPSLTITSTLLASISMQSNGESKQSRRQ